MIERFAIEPLHDGNWLLVEWPYGKRIVHGVFRTVGLAKSAADNLSRETVYYKGASHD